MTRDFPDRLGYFYVRRFRSRYAGDKDFITRWKKFFELKLLNREQISKILAIQERIKKQEPNWMGLLGKLKDLNLTQKLEGVIDNLKGIEPIDLQVKTRTTAPYSRSKRLSAEVDGWVTKPGGNIYARGLDLNIGSDVDFSAPSSAFSLNFNSNSAEYNDANIFRRITAENA